MSEVSDRPERNRVARVSVEHETPQLSLLQTAQDTFSSRPDFFPARVNLFQNRVRLVKMSPYCYNKSTFLDASRVRGEFTIDTDLAWLKVEADKIVWQTTPIIFHTAFCGSTLMSQALAALFDCLPLREPDALNGLLAFIRSHSITQQERDVWFDRVFNMMSRRFELNQVAVIKTNDCANGLISSVLAWRHKTPVLFMYTSVGEFLAGCLRAGNRRDWIRGRCEYIRHVAPHWLNMPSGFSLGDDAYGEMAALYWSYNIALYQNAWQHHADQLRSLEFNQMLVDPLAATQACGKWFELRYLPDTDIEDAMNMLLSVYSKNSKHAYSPQQRRQDVDQLLDANRSELEAAERLAQQLLGDKYPETGLPGSVLG